VRALTVQKLGRKGSSKRAGRGGAEGIKEGDGEGKGGGEGEGRGEGEGEGEERGEGEGGAAAPVAMTQGQGKEVQFADVGCGFGGLLGE